MKVAIIGTGNVGRALGGTIARAGHEVTLAARDADKTREVAREVGATAAETAAQAAEGADVVILAVPYAALPEVAEELGVQAAGTVVIDVTNPLKPDYSGLATDGGPSAAEQLAERLPEARVAKAFNTLFGSIQADPDAAGTTADALYATNDDEARRTIARLIASLGFRPVDAGSLDAARQMEALAWLNMRMQMQYGGDWRSTFVLVGAPDGATSAAQ
jgi:NADPH-dependent F420 reductase